MQRAASRQQAASPAVGKGGRKAALHAWQNGRPGTARRRSGHGTARWKGKARSACRECRNRPPDGTGHRQRCLAMKAGSFENHRAADNAESEPKGSKEAVSVLPRVRRSPKSPGTKAGERGAGGNTGPICFYTHSWCPISTRSSSSRTAKHSITCCIIGKPNWSGR